MTGHGTKAARFFKPELYLHERDETVNAHRLRRDLQKVRGTNERDALIISHQHLGYHIAREFIGRGISFDDLVSEAMYGLCVAADEYDPVKGQFSTYAFWVVRRILHDAIRSHRRSNGKTISEQRQLPQIYQAMSTLQAKFQRNVTAEEIAAESGQRTDQVEQLLTVDQRRFVRIDALDPVADDVQLHETIPDQQTLTPEQLLEAHQQLEFISSVRQQLYQLVMTMHWSAKQKEAFCLRYRLGERGLFCRSMVDVGRQLQVSESRVSQVLTQGWSQLRRRHPELTVTPGWLRQLPEMVEIVADVVGEEVIVNLFGPPELWRLTKKPKEPTMANKAAQKQPTGLTKSEAALLNTLRQVESNDAHIVAEVIERLPFLSERVRRIVVLRFGFHNGTLQPLKNREVAEQLKINNQQVGMALFTAFTAFHKHGLPKRIAVRAFNPILDKARLAINQGGTKTRIERPAAKPKLAKAVDLRSALRDYVASRQLEERVLRLWLVGSEEHFGPMEPGAIATLLGMPEEDIHRIIDLFQSTLR